MCFAFALHQRMLCANLDMAEFGPVVIEKDMTTLSGRWT